MSNPGDDILVLYVDRCEIRARKFRHFITYYTWSNQFLLENQLTPDSEIMLVTHVSEVDFSMYRIEDGEAEAEKEREKRLKK